MKSTQTPPAAPAAKPSPYAGLPTGRVLGVRRCPHCGIETAEPVGVCPECGEPLQTKPKQIRCRQCGGQALSSLALCPQCGRELRPAPPRLLTWGAPAVVVVLFLAVLVARWDGGNPVSWAAGSLEAGLGLFRTLEDQADPSVVVVMTPVVADVEAASVAADPVQATAETQALVATEMTPPPVAEQPVAAAGPTDTPEPAPTATQTATPAAPSPASAPTDLPPATAPASSQADAIATPAITGTVLAPAALLPTATPIITDTAEPASAAPVPPMNSRGGLVAAIVGATQPTTATSTATATPTGTPTATETAVANQVTYQIRPGDTLVVIAGRFAVSVEDLMGANNLAANDAYTIQPGQTLIIPSPAGTAQASPTSTPTATGTATPTATPPPTVGAPTPDAPTPEPTPSVGWRLAAPVLRSPESGAQVSCSATDSLVWLPVAHLAPTDLYVMHLGYVNGRAADGSERVVWILEQPRPANATSWEMDGDTLCGLAPQAFGRQWRWYVQVAAQADAQADGKLTPVSPPSDIWGFTWN